MNASETGQVVASAAEVYETFFLPALFQQWADRVADAANIQPGQQVLDVACGTGVLARAVARRVGSAGSVVGVDVNEGMLAVAQRKAPAIVWKQARAEALPLDSASVDAVVSQFGLMFFTDRRTALREMLRVMRSGGRLAVAVWDSLDQTPGYAAMAGLLDQLFGNQVAQALRAPFTLGDQQLLRSVFAEAGMPDAQITTQGGVARFPSIQSWVYTDIKGWTLADMLDGAQFDRLLTEAEQVLRPFVTADGTVAFSAPAHIVTATKA
jgi:ubiquinone/menaquinone biosynthesis C-methylase UbiE